MSRSSRIALLVIVGSVLWIVLLAGVWATRPLNDSVPVGIDQTLTAPRAVSQRVDCNTLFDDKVRPDRPLPTLRAQPAGQPALAYQRTPCELVHWQARMVFGLNGIAAAGLIGFSAFALARQRRSSVALSIPTAA